MLSNIPKISVLVICYKQEDVIRRALDSLISQQDYIYEICINDDMSPDGTWDILLEYQAKYPDLIKPVQNNPNLGIFQNIEATWKRPSGDIIYQLSGDDEVPNGYFKHVVDFILDNNIDYKNQAMCIYGDYVQVNVDGSSMVYKNNLVEGKNAIKLKLRKLLSNRSAVFSRSVLERHEPVSQGRSFIAEGAQDIELQLFSDKNYYIPFVGNIYYAEIGVSKTMSKNNQEERAEGIDKYLYDFLERHNYKVPKSIVHYDQFITYQRQGSMKALYHYILSIDPSLGLAGLQLDRIFFVLKKRLRNKNAK